MVNLRTFTNGREDLPPSQTWTKDMWVERGEDWYGLSSYGGHTVRVVTREDWLDADFEEIMK